MVKTLHESVRQQIEKRNRVCATKANNGRKHVVFQPSNWVWVHMSKERFPAHRKSKLQPQGDGPFQILERIDDNAYKVDLPGEYGVSVTFNVYDLTLFDVGDDSRLKREGMMRISSAPSVIMPTTHWRCQLGQSQELGQKSLKKHRIGLFRTYETK